MQFKNPQIAFNQAISDNRLTKNPNDRNYAGNYMYMGTDKNGRDLFKNIMTREYDV